MNGSIRVCERCGVPFAGMGCVLNDSTVLCDECAEPLTFERARWLIQYAAESLVTIPPQGFRWESIRDGFASEMVGEVEDFARVRELAVLALADSLAEARVCPVGDLVGDPHTFTGSGVSVSWDVLGDARPAVQVCANCSGGAE